MPNQEETCGQNPETASTAVPFLKNGKNGQNSAAVIMMQHFLVSVPHEAVTEQNEKAGAQEHSFYGSDD